MKLGDLLKVFIDYSGVTITELAKVIGYDRSYLSKWVNNREIPVENKWESICEKLASFFSENISDFDFQRILIDFYIEDQLKNTSKYEVLKYVINKCYTESSLNFSIQEEYNKSKYVRFLKDKNEITDYLKRLLIEDHLNLDTHTTFYYYGNLLNVLNEKDFGRSVTNIILPKTISIKFSTRDFIKERQPSLETLNDYLLMISNESNINIELYKSSPKDERLNAFTITNKVFGWGFSGDDFIPEKFFVSENEDQIKRIIFKLGDFFKEDTGVLTLNRDLNEVIKYMKKKKPGKDQAICFIPRANIYLSSLELRERMYNERRVNTSEYKLWGDFYEVFIDLEKKDTKFIFLSENINNILTDGLIYSAGGIHKLYGENLNVLIRDISKLFRDNKHIEMISTETSAYPKLPQCIVYSDKEEVYIIKFNRTTPYNLENILYHSKDRDFSELVYGYLQSLIVKE